MQMFGLSLLWAHGRTLHATGYTEKYGKHGVGFALSTLAALTAEGLVNVAAAFGIMHAYYPSAEVRFLQISR